MDSIPPDLKQQRHSVYISFTKQGKNKLKKLTLLLIVLVSSLSTFGQSVEKCNAALSQDLMNTSFNRYRSEIKVWLYEYFRLNSEQRQSKKNTAKAEWGISAVVEALPVSFTGSGDTSNQSAKFRRIEKESLEQQFVSDSQLNEIATATFSDNQLTAYRECLKANSQSLANGLTHIEGGDFSDVFWVQVEFRSTTGQQKITLLQDLAYTNMEPVNGLLFRKDTELFNGQSVTQYFKRVDPEKPASISFSFKEPVGNVTPIEIAGAPRYKDKIPVGTIIASVLEYRTFLAVNNLLKNGSSGELETDFSKIQWIPCDGRANIGNSAYGKHGGTVPDLRGLFIRGINDYGNYGLPLSGVPTLNADRKNPEDKKVNEYQSDELKEHTHGLTELDIGGGEQDVRSDNVRAKWRNNVQERTDATGGIETRPKNVTVYYYIKIN